MRVTFMVQQDLGACDKDRNLSPHFPHTCWKFFKALSVIKTNEWIYNTENKWNMVKFAHISNYSDLIGFTIFKCGSGYCNRLICWYRHVKRFLFSGVFPYFPFTHRKECLGCLFGKTNLVEEHSPNLKLGKAYCQIKRSLDHLSFDS